MGERDAAPRATRPARRWRPLRLVGAAALLLVITIGIAEVVLQGAALFARDRQRGWRPDAPRRIACVGDSHTYGALVPAEQSYPGQLQRLLDERAPGAYAVLNLGVPGMNTFQVRTRLRDSLAAHHPELVLVWCGVNNAWNRRESALEDGWWPALDRWLLHLRTYRLVRILLHDRRLDRAVASLGGAPQQRADILVDPSAPEQRFVVLGEGGPESVHYEDSGLHADAEMERRAESDYRGMVEDARAAGARIGFITYPVDQDAFSLANRAMRRVAAELGVPIVESGRSVSRVSAEHRQLLWGAHPTGPMYTAVAGDIVPLVLGEPVPGPGQALARLTFDEDAAAPTAGLDLTGTCGRSTTGGARGGACYRWDPRGGRCYAEQALARPETAVRAVFRLSVAEAPDPAGGREVFGVFEDAYGTGIHVQFADADRLRLVTSGGGGAQGHCGPLKVRLRPRTWYGVRMEAEKSDGATVSLALLDEGGHVLDTATCTNQPVGGGYFTRVRLGSANPAGSRADVLIDDVEVTAAPGA
jgi:hypothetical protein